MYLIVPLFEDADDPTTSTSNSAVPGDATDQPSVSANNSASASGSGLQEDVTEVRHESNKDVESISCSEEDALGPTGKRDETNPTGRHLFLL